MCLDCFEGRSISSQELAGDSGAEADREAQRAYYHRNRDRVLARHRKWNAAHRRSATSCVTS